MAFQVKNEEHLKVETSSREEYCKEVVSKLMQTLGKISTLAAKNGSLLRVGRTIDYILSITLSMLNEKFITIQDGFKDEIVNIVGNLEKSYSLVSYYLLSTELLSPISDDIRDAITSIAICALDLEQIEVTMYCLKGLHNISVAFVERDRDGYDVARCAARISIIGAYGIYKSKDCVSDKAAEFLADFDKAYLQKSPNPHDRLHIEEMRALHKGFNEDYLVNETKVYGNSFKNVTSKDLDEFSKLYEEKRKKIVK